MGKQDNKKNDDKEEKRLEDWGILYVSSINEGSAQSLIQQIIEYNIKRDVEQIQMIINSSGGNLVQGFGLLDIMEWSKIPIYTTGTGEVASIGLMVFMAGNKGKRVLTPKTSILSHRYSSIVSGNHSQLVASRKQHDFYHDKIIEHYLKYTNIKSKNELEEYLLRDIDTWLTPNEAIQYGIADNIESC
ncbi:MAG: ATP-dependent Clp protease proteolytic subunit [Desulfobacterales bacterium]|nr:ATP-dependent Clp protease proteolytic subunit [Desulfobacterales bacterium]